QWNRCVRALNSRRNQKNKKRRNTPMKKLKLAFILALGIAGNQALASSHSYDLYTANEGSVDLFGAWGSRNRDGQNSDAWGPGAGVNYFFTENIGAGADTY